MLSDLNLNYPDKDFFMKRICFFSVLLLTLLVVGCNNNVPLKGKVYFNDDHSPLTAGIVIFDNGTQSGRANIESDGSFIVGFEENQNGIPAGTWRLAIGGAVNRLPCPENEDNDTKNDIYPWPSEQLIDLKYESVDTSGLSITVDKNTKTFEIGVDRPSQK